MRPLTAIKRIPVALKIPGPTFTFMQCDGKVLAYDATDGKKQYVSIAVGWGGNPGYRVRFTKENYPGTIFTFALDAKETYSGFYTTKPKELIQLPVSASAAEISNGQLLYDANCRSCHDQELHTSLSERIEYKEKLN
ncbi:hypothetical protein [Flavihumibacter fluvii]|uniref:hypothetical protein n=1 Tax=Flavihumibacter fluvii TaxID=2838157 RepID=UPI001BDDEFB9|nr:hypothetical protein [Flavihumibacter fluvii]ULQ54308.1 hypothetical protein KJS93_08255 [Flavihumibacter fluvii]